MRIGRIIFLLLIALPLQAGVRGDLRAGGKLYKQKKYGQALAKYNQVLEQHPAETEAALGAGAAAYYLKDYATAKQAFEQAAEQETNPQRTDALFNLGNTYYRANQTDQAKQAFRQAILKNPGDKEALHNFQLLLQEQKNQQNKNNQNDKNQDKQSPNQDKQPQNNPAQSPDQQDTAAKEAADRVMQMAREREVKPSSPSQQGQGNNVEKDW